MEFYQGLLFTAIISVLLASLLVKLFAVAGGDEADRDVERPSIAAERGGNASIRSYEVPPENNGSDHEMECEEERGVGAVEVNSAEISAEGGHDEVQIERFDGGLISEGGEVAEVSGARVPEDASCFLIEEGVGLVGRRLGDLLRTKGKVENVDVFFVRESECGDTVVGSTEGEIGHDPAREAREIRERQFVQGAKELQLDLEKEGRTGTEAVEARVERVDVILVRENESGEYNVEPRFESTSDVKEQSLLNEEDDWEGIEPTELQKNFCEAAAYVGSKGGEFALSNLSGDEQMQLYGLLKVATEGPCYDPQPMALKVSARAKWHAWQRLGNMNPDAAMERYMSLLSEKIPGFISENRKEEVVKQEESGMVEPGLSGACMPNLCSNIHSQLSPETERRQE